MKKNEKIGKKDKKKAFRELVKKAREDSEVALELTQDGNHHVLDEKEIAELSQRASQKAFRFD